MDVCKGHAHESVKHEESLDEGHGAERLIELGSPIIALRSDIIFWCPLEDSPRLK